MVTPVTSRRSRSSFSCSSVRIIAVRSSGGGSRTSWPSALHCAANASFRALMARSEPLGGVCAVTPAAFRSLWWNTSQVSRSSWTSLACCPFSS